MGEKRWGRVILFFRKLMLNDSYYERGILFMFSLPQTNTLQVDSASPQFTEWNTDEDHSDRKWQVGAGPSESMFISLLPACANKSAKSENLGEDKGFPLSRSLGALDVTLWTQNASFLL